jgi:phosphoribosylanthranilate isomerase
MNYTQPIYVTLTGVGNNTDLRELADLSLEFPGVVEWGVLMSSKKAGEPRYPTLKKIEQIINLPTRFSLHLCGDYARQVNGLGNCKDVQAIITPNVRRIQVNSKDYTLQYCYYFRQQIGRPVIIQWREKQWPIGEWVEKFDWLYDCSGGTGKKPESWPIAENGFSMLGYAGGIGPDNVMEVVKTLRATADRGAWFWIDMETQLRNEECFSLKKCRQVLKAVQELTMEDA